MSHRPLEDRLSTWLRDHGWSAEDAELWVLDAQIQLIPTPQHWDIVFVLWSHDPLFSNMFRIEAGTLTQVWSEYNLAKGPAS